MEEAISCMSIPLSIRMEHFDSHWTDLHEIWYLHIFLKFVDKIKISLKSGSKKGTSHEDVCIFVTLSRWILLEWEIFEKNTDLIFNNSFPKTVQLMW